LTAGGDEAVRIRAIAGADLVHEPGGWAFAERQRDRIDAHWAGLVKRNPRVWNGEMLMGFDPAIVDGRLAMRMRTIDYASFIAWRDWGFADHAAWNCFGSPAMVSSDGALIYGIMGAHTLNAGLAYPPSGSLEPRDIEADGRVDIEGSMATEVREETGLDLGEAEAGEVLAVYEARRLSIARVYRFQQLADRLVARIEAFMGRQDEPELAGLVAVRGQSDLQRPMPAYARALARHVLHL